MRSRLPVGVAAFVGRAAERAKVADLITAGRLVTLTGPGGCGKTRLAIEVAADVASRFADGAYWADLQGLSEPGLVASTVGAALEIHERSDESMTDTLVDHLRDLSVLVVLDNCEHVVGACAELVGALSSACPNLRVLSTSRVPLVVDGEATFDVAPLPAGDAAQLFEVRARQVSADFRIDDDNAAAVADICRRLDGIPLAIELAAARVRVLSPEQIAAGLSDRFRLLTGGTRGAPARQRTLEASLDWSYDLLDDRQRLALARLSVFAASFELDAAAAVVGDGGTDNSAALDVVAGLVERSLLQATQQHGRARYRLLETIRIYARQRLSELDDPVRVRDRHLAFHVELAGRAAAGLASGEPESWVARLASDLDDLRAAMDWAAESANLPALVAITEPIVRFWFECGLSREVHKRLHAAALAAGASAPDSERVRGLMAATALALASNAPADAFRSAHDAVDAARAVDAGATLALALGQRAFAGVLSGLSTTAQVDSDVEQALQQAEQLDASTRAYLFAFAGAALGVGRSIDAGCDLFEQAVAVCEANDLLFQLPAALASLGGGIGPAREWSGRLGEARTHAQRAVDLGAQVGRPGWEAAGLVGLGAAAALAGEHVSAREWLSQAQEVLRARSLHGSQYDAALRHWVVLSAYASGDVETARVTADEMVRISRGGGNRWHESIGEWVLGVLARRAGKHDEARAHQEASRSLSTDPRLSWPLGRSLLELARLAPADEIEHAWELAHESLEVLDDYGDSIGSAAALETIAHLATGLGEPERSLRLLAGSQRFHDETGVARFPADADYFDLARTSALAALDATDAAAYWEAGAALSLADAVAYARRGRGERQRPQLGWASLTPVERDVVRLVAAGHTNGDIGQRLFISVNTVKKHLSHVYAKLDVDGRAGLAAEVARREP